jgi:hypothetical protein
MLTLVSSSEEGFFGGAHPLEILAGVRARMNSFVVSTVDRAGADDCVPPLRGLVAHGSFFGAELLRVGDCAALRPG